MATLNIVLCRSNTDSSWGGALPVAQSIPQATATIATTGATQAVTMVAVGTGSIIPQALGGIWCVTCKGGNATIAFNGAAVANTSQWDILDGQTRWFGVTTTAETINVITST